MSPSDLLLPFLFVLMGNDVRHFNISWCWQTKVQMKIKMSRSIISGLVKIFMSGSGWIQMFVLICSKMLRLSGHQQTQTLMLEHATGFTAFFVSFV